MATIKQIQFKRSNVAGKRPLPADIAEGELAINTKDATLFTKNSDGAIIDLGFAKGGRIDGDVTQVGNYTQTGDYTTSGNITAKNINASSEVISNGGVLRTRADATSNAHVWFEGNESGTSKERAVLYALPQTKTSGDVALRVQNGSDQATNGLFVWTGNGDFQVQRDVLGQRARLDTEVITPTVTTSRLLTKGRKYGQFGTKDNLFGWNDLVEWVSGTDGAQAVNYVYTGRASFYGRQWKQLIDDRGVASEWVLYTANGSIDNKMFGVRSNNYLGEANITGSLHVGGTAWSTLGQNSITVGDGSTGLRKTSGSYFDVIDSGKLAMRFSTSSKANISLNRLYISNADSNGAATNPDVNSAQLQIDTSGDANNVSDNGFTFIGYYSANGEYNHYFRGKGEAAFSMTRGLRVDRGGIKVTGDSNFANTLTVTALKPGYVQSAGDISLNNPAGRHIKFEYITTSGTTATDGFIFKDGPSAGSRRPGIRVIASNPDTGVESGTYIFGEDGNFVSPKQVIPTDYSNFDNKYVSTFNLGANKDLNTIVSPGEYAQEQNSNTSLDLNYPEAQAGHLTVTAGAGLQQKYHVYNTSRVYTRATVGNGAWTAWIRQFDQSFASGWAQFKTSASDGFKIAYGNYGIILRRSEDNFYIIPTEAGQAENGGIGSLRPFTMSCATGATTINTLSSPNNIVAGAATFRTDGNVFGSAWNLGNGNLYNHINAYAVAKTGDVMTGNLTVAAGVGRGAIAVNGNTLSTAGALISGDVNGGSHQDWQERPAGLLVSCASSDNEAYNIWKATQWGRMHIAAMDAYAPGGNAYVRLVLNMASGHQAHIWNVNGYTAPGNGSFNDVQIRSDIRLKGNLVPIESAIDKIDTLTGYTYDKKEALEDEEYKYKEAGLIAQDLEKVLPEAISHMENGTKTISSSATIALLVQGIKELSARVKELESKL